MLSKSKLWDHQEVSSYEATDGLGGIRGWQICRMLRAIKWSYVLSFPFNLQSPPHKNTRPPNGHSNRSTKHFITWLEFNPPRLGWSQVGPVRWYDSSRIPQKEKVIYYNTHKAIIIKIWLKTLRFLPAQNHLPVLPIISMTNLATRLHRCPWSRCIITLTKNTK